MVLAESASDSVRRMENVCTMPTVWVKGAKIVPSAMTDAFHIRLMPPGT